MSPLYFGLLFLLLPAAFNSEAGFLCRAPHSPPKTVGLLDVKIQSTGISPDRELGAVLERLRNVPRNGRAQVEVFRVSTLDHTHLAIFDHTKTMNAVLDRATDYIDGSGKITAHSAHLNGGRLESIAGHDFRSEDMRNYLRVYKSKDLSVRLLSEKELEFVETEELFWDEVMKPIMEDPNAVFIAVAADTSPFEILSHELLHARYFEDAVYRQTLLDFWTTVVTKSDRKRVRNALESHYDVKDEDLMINEFQAYILQRASGSYDLGALARKYRRRLLQVLKKAGFEN